MISIGILRRIRIAIGISTIWISSIGVSSVRIAVASIGIGRRGRRWLLRTKLLISYGLSISLKALKSSPRSTIPSELSSIDLMASKACAYVTVVLMPRFLKRSLKKRVIS